MNRENIFPITIGLVDGIITTLMITSGRIASGVGLGIYHTLKIASGSALVGAASYFVAQYSKMRNEVSRVSKHLNPEGKRVKKSAISRIILVETIVGTLAAALFGFMGSMIPLLGSISFPDDIFVPFFLSLVSLGILGIFVGKYANGSSLNWSVALVIMGVIVTIAGIYLNIIP
ncbi:MAG: VIT1/CCC1 transporter family protein [Thermoplasmataceae archaeon]